MNLKPNWRGRGKPSPTLRGWRGMLAGAGRSARSVAVKAPLWALLEALDAPRAGGNWNSSPAISVQRLLAKTPRLESRRYSLFGPQKKSNDAALIHIVVHCRRPLSSRGPSPASARILSILFILSNDEGDP
jgi:hypothetical protein